MKQKIMRKIIFSTVFFLIAFVSFSQDTKENGTIYIKHPYIDVVNKSVKAYLANDVATNSKFFADTAKFFGSSMDKAIPIADALKMWSGDFKYYDNIQLKPVGYPDYLHYADEDQKYVQSWWEWSGTSKKTGKVLKINCVQFDSFNKAGKIAFESLYGDFSKMEHAEN
jgi:hypothetical protein